MKKEIKILDIFYGNQCNLTCNQCDTRSDHIRKGQYDPDIENIKRSIDLANEYFDVQKWSVLGGEPLLYLDKVEEILDHLRSIEPNKVIFFPTNGSLLDRHMDRLVDMVKKYKLWVQVCDHFVAFDDKTKSNQVREFAYELARKLELPKAESSQQWWYDIMDVDSGSNDWKEYMRKKGHDISQPEGNETAWIKENYGVYYMEAHSFQSIHKFDYQGKPKPFNSPNPAASYWNSCPSCFCALLYDKKIYKCAALGTLRNFLDLHGSLDDPEWQKYLNYSPVDLENCTDETVHSFGSTHYSHIDECSMCPENLTPIRKTEENVLPMYFKKKP
jgi:organic radical activating enzyme